ncbi:hypothetical protein KAW08_02230 [bacterium]|nr:hypothetical protein [bacterium]
MNSRERVLAAMKREEPDRLPFEILFTPPLEEVVKTKTKSLGFEKFFGINSDVRHVWVLPTRKDVNLSSSRELPANLEELKSYPFPDLTAEYRYEGLIQKVRNFHQNDFCVSGWGGHTFEAAWGLTGMEKFMMDWYIKREAVEYILDRITTMNCFMAEKMVRAGVDILRTGDDVGMEDRMIMSPDMWREMLKPRLAKVIKRAKKIKPDILIWYHSDGKINPIIEDLIEIGVDILNPVQPECMDSVELKKRYGDRLSFWGCLGTQTTMPFGKPQDVKKTVKTLFNNIGKGGGFLLAPSHRLQPDVPWDNIVAFIEAIRECNY